jgi:hypothetical protein
MDCVELLTVQDRFQLSGIGLTVTPDFPVPNGWRNIEEPVEVELPSGERFEVLGQFNMTHFNISDPAAGVERRWRLLVTLTTMVKEQVPIGSRLFVSEQTRNAILASS